jgi:Arc/MetJ family transcription regulator
MPTNLAIDDRLIVEARRLGGYKTKKEAVNQALALFIRQHKQQRVLDSFGQIEWDEGYDHKAARKRP